MSLGSIIFMIILGAGMLFAYRKSGQDNRTMKEWPTAPAKILKKDVFDAPRQHQLILQYEFFVKGVRYQSGNVYRELEQYDLGYPYDLDKVEFLKNPVVKYNPENPSDCCLLLWYDKFWFRALILVAGIVLSLIGWINLLVKIFKHP